MPLRDHFRPPLSLQRSWQMLHGQWPAVMVQLLNAELPSRYVAGPRLYLGSQAEIDIATLEQLDASSQRDVENHGGVATAEWIASPALRVETELSDFDEYEVRVYDQERGQLLVAAIEIVSPANKDRPESRDAFIQKCAGLLKSGVAVSIVDLVTERQFNLYADLMRRLRHPDPTMSVEPPEIYAASCRWLAREPRGLLESWSHTLVVGEPLPRLPLWLSETLVHPLDLEQSYEQACRDLRIR